MVGRRDSYEQVLNRDINIFFGANGSGKTSLLRILDSAMSGDASILRRVPFKSAAITIFSSQYQRSFVRSISRTEESSKLSSTSSRMLHRWQSPFEEDTSSFPDVEEGLSWNTTPAKPDTAKTRWSHIYLPTWRAFHIGSQTPPESAQLSFFRSSNDAEREHDWDITFAERLEQLWIRYSNELLGEVQSIQGEGLGSILRAIIAPNAQSREVEQLDPDTAYRLVVAFLERQGTADILGTSEEFYNRYQNDSQLRLLVSDIDTIEQRILGAMASRNRLEQLIQSMYTQNKSVTLNNTGIEVNAADGDQIGLSSLSSGEKQSLRIFIDALRAEENTLLIDEPEISLHIDWQRALVASIRDLNPEAQLILATHSPEIMAEIPDDKIFRI